MSDSFDHLVPIAEANAAAFYLTYNLNFNYWPKYFKNLLLCYNPFEYQVRFFQIQFIVINRIHFDIYLFILQLNYHVGLGTIDRNLKNKLSKLYDYVSRKALSSPTSISSYNITLDGVCNYNNDYIFRRDELGDYVRTSEVAVTRYCNLRNLREYLRSIGVFHHFYNSY